QSIVETFEVDDARGRANAGGAGRATRLAPFGDERHAEVAVLAHAVAHHVEIARFEDAQTQRTAREQHGIQWKQRQDHRHESSLATSACAAGPATFRECRRSRRWT